MIILPPLCISGMLVKDQLAVDLSIAPKNALPCDIDLHMSPCQNHAILISKAL